MSATSNLARNITEIAIKSNAVEVLQPAKIGVGSWQNELLLFIKPEVFLVPEPSQSEKTVDLILNKIGEFDAQLDGIAVVGGQVLEDKEIMSRHYGFINTLSQSASTILSDDDRRRIEVTLGISISDYDILGGHEYLREYPEETGSDLDHQWFAEKSAKIRSGFYVRRIKRDGRDILLVNGFHPEQLAHFTNPSHKIVLILLYSNTNWSTLKNEMVGATFPEKAATESIRGILYAHAKEYGFESVTIANNCVHLSAGPFEGMFEIVNFFGKIMGMDVEKQPPLVLRRMLEEGIDYRRAIRVLDNPPITLHHKVADLFTATEDMNTDEAIALYKGTLSSV